MTLNGGACIINYSGAVLTKCPKDFDLLFFKVGRAKEKESELVLLLLLNYQLESRVEKDAERFSHLCQCKRLARVLIISRTLLNGSLLPVESQLQSSFCLSNISRPLVVLQISTGGLIESFQSFI